MGRADTHVFELLTQGSTEGTAAHLPEFGHVYLGGVQFESRTHRGEEDGPRLAGPQYQQGLVLEAVDGIDDVVVLVQIEVIGRILIVYLLQGHDVGLGVYL